MMQQRLGQTSLNNSSKTNIENEQKKSANDVPLSYWDILQREIQTSSVWDLLSGDPLEDVDLDEVLQKKKTEKPKLRPYVSFNDLNNSDDAPYENKPKPAIEVGIAFDF